MDNKTIYKIWAPFNKKWVDWVRPVSFIAINNNMRKFQPVNFTLPCLTYLKEEDMSSMAIIVDLPDTQSVEAGILLAKQCGYRPVPIYNGTIEQRGSRATTDNSSILSALVWGAEMLSRIDLKDNANPAFLTDTNRLDRHKIDSSIFDNSWDVYHQDLPTEEYFLQNGISKILVISDKLSKDLKKIFLEYPQKKISIFLSDGYEEPKCVRKGK